MSHIKTKKHPETTPEQLRLIGRHRDAERRARVILERDPNHIGALETLAKVQWHFSDLVGLQPTLDRLIALNPYEPGYHALRGAVLQALGRCGEAVVSYSRCIDGDSDEAANARVQISELQDWERFLVADLLERDQVFRAEYAHDPREACRKRGFEFVDQPTEKWVPTVASVVIWARPS